MTKLKLMAKQDHLEKVAKTNDPIKALSEFVWNALDADATVVSVDLIKNPLGGIQEIQIIDNGSGISPERAHQDFGSLGESWKKKRRSTSSKRALHGKEGRGRLRFFSISEGARWKSVYNDSGKLHGLRIVIASGALDDAEVSEPIESNAKASGVVVELSPLKQTFDWLTTNEAYLEFTALFAPYVLQYPNVSLSYDGKLIQPRQIIAQEYDFPRKTIIGPNRTIRDLSLKVIEWKSHIENRKIHLGGDAGVVLGSQPAHVVAPGFEYSAYAYSAFFQQMADDNFLEIEGLTDPDFAKVMEFIRDELASYFQDRQAERAQGLIEELISSGAYPYKDDPKDEIERRERQVFDIATYAVSSYSKEFKGADASVKKLTLTLLREALRHNPESLSNILRAVVNLPKNRQDEFSSLLDKTQLGNIITASSLIADRITALSVLGGLVFKPEHRASVKERGELDALIHENTWMFGEHFHITMAEAGLTKVIDRVAVDLGGKTSTRRTVRKSDGRAGRVDCFLGRSIPHPELERREYLVVELKRPSLKIGRKEIAQLEDYVVALKDQPEFVHTATYWNFYLVTGEYDELVRDRITQKDRPVGLLLEKDNYRIWVRSWAEIIRECEGRLKFIQDKLKVEVTDAEIEARISAIKSAYIAGDTRKVVRFPKSISAASQDHAANPPE